MSSNDDRQPECLGACYGKFCAACQGDAARVGLRIIRKALEDATNKEEDN